MYKILFLILFAGTLWFGLPKVESLIAASAKAQIAETIPTIGLGPFLQLCRSGNIVIIDMRSKEDYDRSHIKSSLSVHQLDPADGLHSRLGRTRNTVLYSSGSVNEEMRQYAKALSKQGIQGVVLYSGGFREWLAAGLPVEKGE